MSAGKSDVLREQVPAMAPFVEWTIEQGGLVCLAALAYTIAISDVIEGRMMVGEMGISFPNFWVLRDAAEALGEMAALAGFDQAAQFCEQTRQEACGAMASLEEVLRQLGVVS